MENKLTYKYRPNSKDWIASYELEDGYILNFYCGNSQDQKKIDTMSVSEFVTTKAISILPEVKKFWEDYIQDMYFIFGVDEEEISDGIYDKNTCTFRKTNDENDLNIFSKENILLREWYWPSPQEPAYGCIVDALGRVWESSDGDIDGWHEISGFYPTEIWPLRKIPTTSYQYDILPDAS
jgi:hypothetical protein